MTVYWVLASRREIVGEIVVNDKGFNCDWSMLLTGKRSKRRLEGRGSSEINKPAEDAFCDREIIKLNTSEEARFVS